MTALRHIITVFPIGKLSVRDKRTPHFDNTHSLIAEHNSCQEQILHIGPTRIYYSHNKKNYSSLSF